MDARRRIPLLAAVLASALAFASPLAALEPGIEGGTCELGPLVALHDEIASAPTVADARALAAPPLALARGAMERARGWLPGASGLAEGERRLRAGEEAVAAATTPAAVAGAFAGAVSGSMPLAGVDIDPPSCSYSTLEIVAIVLGFILGIIPGLILLVLLC